MIDGKILVGVVTLVVAAILVAGLYSLFRGGEFARTNSNRLMRLRLIAQFVAIAVIMAVLYLSGRGP
jgi:hypothetical protein